MALEPFDWNETQRKLIWAAYDAGWTGTGAIEFVDELLKIMRTQHEALAQLLQDVTPPPPATLPPITAEQISALLERIAKEAADGLPEA